MRIPAALRVSCFKAISGLLLLEVVALQGAIPEVGKALTPLPVEVLQSGGGYAPVDIAKAAGEKPVVYLLVPAQKWDRPVARFMKTLDDKLPGYSATAEVRAVWLTAEADAVKEYLPRARQSLQLQHTSLAVFPDETGPEGWQPSGDMQLTVVVAHRGKIAATFSFGSVNETDVPPIGEAVEKALADK